MLVYRVEHREYGQGPYRDHDYTHWHHSYSLDGHPDPERDFPTKAWRDKANKFGFSSLQQLRDWFTATELYRMREAGFHVVVYDVPAADVIIGGSQVAFPGKRISYSYGPLNRADDEALYAGVGV